MRDETYTMATIDKYFNKTPADSVTSSEKSDAQPNKKLKTGSSSKVAGHASTKDASSSKSADTCFQFKEVKGDLFKCHASHSLAHCISEDVRMGKGIATLFKSKFGGVDDLKRQGVKTGGVAVLKRNGRFIYYLITKEKYWQKPTYESLQSTLEAMANHCREHKVTHVSMPRIGCGLDGLKWPTVADIIKKTFKDTNITVTVYTL